MIIDLRRRKKLIALLYDAFMDREGQYIEVFLNPTSREIENLKQSDSYNSYRAVIEKNGDVYAWKSDILHNLINNYLKNKIGIDKGLKIEISGTDCHIDAQKIFTLDEITNFIKNNQIMFLQNLNYNIFNIKDNGNIDEYEFYSYNEIMNFEKK